MCAAFKWVYYMGVLYSTPFIVAYTSIRIFLPYHDMLLQLTWQNKFVAFEHTFTLKIQ